MKNTKIKESTSYAGGGEIKEQFNKYFNLVNPKQIVSFVDLYRNGELFALDLRDGSEFLMDDSHKDDVVNYINAGVFLFGTEKISRQEK